MKTITTVYRRSICLLLLGILGSFSLSSNAFALAFRWVDETGKVNYADNVPPAVSQGGHAELGKSGIVLKKVSPAKSVEQVEEDKWLSDLEEKLLLNKDQQQREDEQLLGGYADIKQFDAFYAARIKMIGDGRKQMEIMRGKLVDEINELESQLGQAKAEHDKELLRGFIAVKLKSRGEYDKAIEQNSEEEVTMTAEYEKQRIRFLDLLERKQYVNGGS